LLGMPVVQIVIFGYALTNEVKNANIAILDNAKDAATASLTTQLDASRYFALERNIVTYKQIEDEFKKGKIKIGVFGLGIEMAGLVSENLSAGTKYLDPVVKGNEIAATLKKEKNCDLIICLSHLGYQYSDNKVSDKRLANETENIDLIIGGHTHTFLSAPVLVKNKKGDDVIINQVGWAGINLGRLDFDFTKSAKKKLSEASSITITKKTKE